MSPTHVTSATVHDSTPYLERLDRQRERFGLNVCAVGLDASYATMPIAKGLEERNILGVTAYVAASTRKGFFRRREFEYDRGQDAYRCPNGKVLKYARTGKDGYPHYKSDPKICAECPLRSSCIPEASTIKTVTRHVWQEAHERLRYDDHTGAREGSKRSRALARGDRDGSPSTELYACRRPRSADARGPGEAVRSSHRNGRGGLRFEPFSRSTRACRTASPPDRTNLLDTITVMGACGSRRTGLYRGPCRD